MKNLALSITGLLVVGGLLIAPATPVVPEPAAAEAIGGSGIDHDFCGVGYFRADASSINATGRTKLNDGYTWREYSRSIPLGFGLGDGWTTQWNRCHAVIGSGPDYPGSKNFWGDSFTPRD